MCGYYNSAKPESSKHSCRRASVCQRCKISKSEQKLTNATFTEMNWRKCPEYAKQNNEN